VTILSRAAAALLLGVTMVGSLYEVSGLAASLFVRGSIVFSHAFVWFLAAAREGARWWSIAERVGTAVSDTIAAPLTVAGLAAVETTVLLAICAFRHLIQDGSRAHDSGKLRI